MQTLFLNPGSTFQFPGKLLNNPNAKIVSTWSSRRTYIHLLRLLKGLLQRCGSAVACHGDGGGGGGHWQQQSWGVPLGISPPGGHHYPITEPADSRAGLPQAKQLTRGVNILIQCFYLENLNIKGVSTLLLEQNDAKAISFLNSAGFLTCQATKREVWLLSFWDSQPNAFTGKKKKKRRRKKLWVDESSAYKVDVTQCTVVL